MEEKIPDNLHYPCIENFVSAILDGEPMHSPGASAILTDWVTDQVKNVGTDPPFRS